MLQRIYGTSWASQKDLDNYLTRLEEAEKETTENWAKKWTYFILEEKSRISFLA